MEKTKKTSLWRLHFTLDRLFVVFTVVAHMYDLHCQHDGDDRGHYLFDLSQQMTFDGRDDIISKQDLRNLKQKIDKETWLWNDNDQSSIRKQMGV